jgi:hypothetical protein
LCEAYDAATTLTSRTSSLIESSACVARPTTGAAQNS